MRLRTAWKNILEMNSCVTKKIFAYYGKTVFNVCIRNQQRINIYQKEMYVLGPLCFLKLKIILL